MKPHVRLSSRPRSFASTAFRALGGLAALSLGSAPAFAFQGADACANAQDFGPSATTYVLTASATAGAEGQGGACGAIERDVWFRWIAPSNGLAMLSTCTFAAFDTKLKVYAGSGCASAPITCSDDHCGTQSSASFYASAGDEYLFQIGAKPGSNGDLAIVQIGVQSPDECGHAIQIEGRGVFPFDTTSATTGTQGQGAQLCNGPATAAIANDVWYRWTATSTGEATVSTCGFTSVDTKIAIHTDAICPTTVALRCNDDECGLQTRAVFYPVAGSSYLIQLGTKPGASGGLGAFSIDVDTGDCRDDLGASQSTWGRSGGGASCWMKTFGAIGETTVLSRMSVVYGAVPENGFAPPNGTPATIAVWEDPNDDGNPSDAVLLRTQASAVDFIDTDVFNVTNLIPPVTVRGKYFVGVAVPHAAGQRPAAYEVTTQPTTPSWVVGSATGSIDLANLSANTNPPSTFGNAFLLRAGCNPATGDYSYCHSAASGYSCPLLGVGCSNGLPGHGCANSANPNGAMLAAMGNAAVLADSVRLIASGMPPFVPALFFQSTTPGTSVAFFGDGFRCAGGTILRLGVKTASVQGNAAFGYGAGDLPVHERGLVFTPGWRYYQAWYRNSASFCTGGTFNLSNGVAIDWE